MPRDHAFLPWARWACVVAAQAVVLLLGIHLPLAAQTGLTGGSVEGTVRNEAGLPLEKVAVSLVSEDTHISRAVITDEEGHYRIGALPVGRYRLLVRAGGFQPVERAGLAPGVGEVVVVDVLLSLARSEAVWVEHEGKGSGNEGAAVANRVEQSSIDSLPANGRDFVAFSLLTPGVVAERTPPTGPTTSSGLSFAGQRPRSNHVMVDGFDNDDVYTGAVAASFSQEAVQEFQVLAAAAPAEFGNASGGTVNTVTKSGTNVWHGSAFFFLRDRDLDSKQHFEQFDVFGNPIDAPKSPFHQKQWGATLGGPVKQDRTFAFLSLERLDVEASNFVTIDPSVAAVLQRGGFPVTVGSTPYAQGTWSGLVRVDQSFSADHRLLVRGHFSDRTNENVEPFGGIVARSHGAIQLRTDWGVAVAANDSFRSGWVNEARLQVVRGDQSIYGLDPLCDGPCRDRTEGGPEVTLPGVAVFGRQLNTPQLRTNLDLQAADTLTRALGRHTLKAGFTYTFEWWSGEIAQDFGGRYVFTALPAIPGLTPRPLSAVEAFEQGLPASYFQGYGTTTSSGTSRYLSALRPGPLASHPPAHRRGGSPLPALRARPRTGHRFGPRGHDPHLRRPGPGFPGATAVLHLRPDRPRPDLAPRLLRPVPRGSAPGHRPRHRDRQRARAAAAARRPAPVGPGLELARPPLARAVLSLSECRPGRRPGLRRRPLPAGLDRLDPGAGPRDHAERRRPRESAERDSSATSTTTPSSPRWALADAPTTPPLGPLARPRSSSS